MPGDNITNISTGEIIQARKLYSEPIQYIPLIPLILCCNVPINNYTVRQYQMKKEFTTIEQKKIDL
jgi:hypothetical protein